MRITLIILSVLIPFGLYAQEEPWMTIFVHGTFRPYFSMREMIKIAKDSLKDGHYVRNTLTLRDHPFFREHQAIQGYGLQPINTSENCSGCASAALAMLYERHDSGCQAPLIGNLWYTFGWSGLLLRSERAQAARQLYQAITDELAHLEQRGIKPRIRLIGFSHGGNVALQVAQHAPAQWCIDELILIGTPVQKDTDHLITRPCFKKIYHLYSLADYIQNADLISSNYFSSHRRFARRKGLEIPDNLTQIQIRIGRTPRTHLDPGHTELWFFGWTTKRYRKKFPLHPLPVVAFVPLIIAQLSTLTCHTNDVIVDLQLCRGTMTITTPWLGEKKEQHERPFIAPDAFTELQKQIEQLRPPWHTPQAEQTIIKTVHKDTKKALKSSKHKS